AAIRLYRAYLGLLDQPTVEGVDARNELGKTLRIHGRTAESIEEHQRAIDEARAIGDRRAEARSAIGAGDAYFAIGRTAEALARFELAVDASREAGDSDVEASALMGVA